MKPSDIPTFIVVSASAFVITMILALLGFGGEAGSDHEAVLGIGMIVSGFITSSWVLWKARRWDYKAQG